MHTHFRCIGWQLESDYFSFLKFLCKCPLYTFKTKSEIQLGTWPLVGTWHQLFSTTPLMCCTEVTETAYREHKHNLHRLSPFPTLHNVGYILPTTIVQGTRRSLHKPSISHIFSALFTLYNSLSPSFSRNLPPSTLQEEDTRPLYRIIGTYGKAASEAR